MTCTHVAAPPAAATVAPCRACPAPLQVLGGLFPTAWNLIYLIPLYAAYVGYTKVMSIKNSLTGLMGAGSAAGAAAPAAAAGTTRALAAFTAVPCHPVPVRARMPTRAPTAMVSDLQELATSPKRS
ncbi:hypothetical protein EON62_05865 [archaeon]|nr:MAG: hypothetical protein EON62_05865 [archaeon]